MFEIYTSGELQLGTIGFSNPMIWQVWSPSSDEFVCWIRSTNYRQKRVFVLNACFTDTNDTYSSIQTMLNGKNNCH
ncbi:MAG: hypothetical protein P9X24_17995 [Candidatus Hatepunaea meridiana]|nr:hypothetical protein [Candidatus Hatepunaea meridiana]